MVALPSPGVLEALGVRHVSVKAAHIVWRLRSELADAEPILAPVSRQKRACVGGGRRVFPPPVNSGAAFLSVRCRTLARSLIYSVRATSRLR